mgnify:CR=1 FL=1
MPERGGEERRGEEGTSRTEQNRTEGRIAGYIQAVSQEKRERNNYYLRPIGAVRLTILLAAATSEPVSAAIAHGKNEGPTLKSPPPLLNEILPAAEGVAHLFVPGKSRALSFLFVVFAFHATRATQTLPLARYTLLS